MTNAKNKFLLLLLLFLTSFSIAAYSAEQKIVRFPGKVNSLSSPDHKYRLINVDSDKQDEEGNNHYLMIGGSRKIFSYGRYVEVFWSPNSQLLVVNDYGGSDYSSCVIVSMSESQKKSDIGKQLNDELQGSEDIFKNHHLYIEGVKWFDSNHLKVKVRGYEKRGSKNITLLYSYDTRDGLFKKLNR